MSSTPIISVMKVEKLVRHGCEVYLAFVMTGAESKAKLSNIQVVWDFQDAFLKELPRLPPSMEVEFSIELMPSMQAISKAPYRMAPNELKELKTQL